MNAASAGSRDKTGPIAMDAARCVRRVFGFGIGAASSACPASLLVSGLCDQIFDAALVLLSRFLLPNEVISPSTPLLRTMSAKVSR